ncbi:MAG: DUF1080 domain-containing protein, partial [Verrucomicrobiaceae bacterium]|nr:DUF1080 domain-containing protein [Verrucomicrobiaceae bacterium]
GKHIQIWLNGIQTVDYTETEGIILQDGKSMVIQPTGIIAVQIHGNAISIVRYKDIMIEELAAKK